MPMIAPPASYIRRTSFTITFDGGAGTGAIGNVPLFTVTGDVLIVYLVPKVTTTLAGATATLSLGVTNSTALFIGVTTATNLAAGEFWTEATGGNTANAGVGLPAAGTAAPQLKDVAISNNIVGTVATAAVSGGVMRLDCYWLPLSSNGLVA